MSEQVIYYLQPISLGIMALSMLVMGGVAIALASKLVPLLKNLDEQVSQTLSSVRTTVASADTVLKGIDNRIMAKLVEMLDGAQGAMSKVDPLATDLQATLTEARTMLDDATQTSQSVRERIDDLASTQKELTALTTALADVASQVRDEQVVTQLHHVLSDTSLLAADLGILLENTNSYLEEGKPLVSNVSKVVSNAKDRASSITARIGSIKEGVSGKDEK